MIYDLQKASMWKRISAWLFDAILFGILCVGIALLLSGILGYDKQSQICTDVMNEYADKQGINLNIPSELLDAMSEEERTLYNENKQTVMDEASKDERYIKAFSLCISLTTVIISISILVAYLIIEFAIPLLLKNGQTLGKKIFGVAVVRTDGVKVSPFILLIRTLLGKYTVETMIPILVIMLIFWAGVGIIGFIVLALIAILEIAVLCATKTNSAIHDLLAGTVTVDLASQMIFENEQERDEYKKKADEMAAKRHEDY